ncbi:MAG: substrate-binding domain-containing protein, partial [Ruminiclostridium sp.]
MVDFLKIIGGKQKILKKRLYIILSINMFFSCTLSGCAQSAQMQEKPYIAVVVKATESKFWKAVSNGVNAAATEYSVNVTFEGAENEEDYIAQNKLIEKAVANGAQAIVISAIDSNKSVDTIKKALDAGVYVVIIDSGINLDDINVEISTNNYSAGKMAADAVLQNKAKELKIGIVNFDINSANGYQREAGFKEKVLKDDRVEIIDIINVNSNVSSSNAGTKKMLEAHPEINVIATLNEWTTLGVGYAIEELGLADQV